jgi:hypothetical protein
MNIIGDYESRRRDEEFDRNEDARLASNKTAVQRERISELETLIREARDLMREALDDVCGQLSHDAEDWIMRAIVACSKSRTSKGIE